MKAPRTQKIHGRSLFLNVNTYGDWMLMLQTDKLKRYEIHIRQPSLEEALCVARGLWSWFRHKRDYEVARLARIERGLRGDE